MFETNHKMAHPETVRHIHSLFQQAGLTLPEQSAIILNVTGSVSQVWTDLDANTLLAVMVSKGVKNLKAWANAVQETL